MVKTGGRSTSLLFFLLLLLSSNSLAYRPGDIVPMSKMGQYYSSRTPWLDVIGRHCPIFAFNRELRSFDFSHVLIPIEKLMGYTGADPYKMEEQSEIDVTSGFFALFGSGLMLSFILSIYILQSSQDKLTKFVKETVAENSLPIGGVAKVE